MRQKCEKETYKEIVMSCIEFSLILQPFKLFLKLEETMPLISLFTQEVTTVPSLCGKHVTVSICYGCIRVENHRKLLKW